MGSSAKRGRFAGRSDGRISVLATGGSFDDPLNAVEVAGILKVPVVVGAMVCAVPLSCWLVEALDLRMDPSAFSSTFC